MSQEWSSRPPRKNPNRTVREMENTVVEIFERLRLHVKQHIRDKRKELLNWKMTLKKLYENVEQGDEKMEKYDR